MKMGQHSWQFTSNPALISTGVVGGPFEANGKLKEDFDHLYDDIWLEQQSFEKAQQKMMEDAMTIALNKGNITKEKIDLLFSGDLINQITPTTFAAHTIGTQFIGLSSACATSAQSLALGSLAIESNVAQYVLCGTASHHAATERQFRYPTEYGGQKPPTAQWTVTGAGFGLLATNGQGPAITTATIGRVIDLDVTDPFNMGAAMAPAAVDTIVKHLADRQVSPSYYDLIITGDLGKIGRSISIELLHEKGVQIAEENYNDCGLMVYEDEQLVQAGGSGTACSAVVTFGHIYQLLTKRTIQRVLLVATGSLHSPLSVQQKDSIPCIAHAVSIEAKEGIQ
ncbi:MAG TPA: stage V sporulation protein AD [Pseudogracilibacillus sp.]|nr:stage V sporulation protein AD [Pseudogracilibacillus sp.]